MNIHDREPERSHVSHRDLIELYLAAARGFERDGRIEEARQVRRQARLVDHRDGWR